MKRVGFFGFSVLTLLFVSCNNDYQGTRTRQQLSIPRQGTQVDSTLFSPAYANKSIVTQNTPVLDAGTMQGNPLNAYANNVGLDTAAILLEKGLNPPHGSPGHRCDLQVGAPLSSKPEVKAIQPVLNPAHGQPGHRCNIAVGAPLNSKPANNVQPNIQKILSNQPPKDGLNPAHGQPGHRCDIAVGAPLNSKAAVNAQTDSVQKDTATMESATLVDSSRNN